MRKVLLIAIMAISSVTFAQSGLKQDIDVIQSLYGKSKQELVNAYMQLQEPQATPFWAMYDAYESERKALGQKRIMLLDEYVQNFETLSDAKADALVKSVSDNNIAFEKLFVKYYGKAKKIVGAVNAVKFMQLEGALYTAVKAETQNAIPFVGEIDRSVKK
jgi:hypothetical protein